MSLLFIDLNIPKTLVTYHLDSDEDHHA